MTTSHGDAMPRPKPKSVTVRRTTTRRQTVQVRRRRVRHAPGPVDKELEAYRRYFWRVMDRLYRQVSEHGDACPPALIIPKPADAYQMVRIKHDIEWWARMSFNRPDIEVRTDQGQQVN
jgi:hypothetical protein